ncbi:MAG: cyclic nucleotide-binding domain-containing protein [Candidatus Latescibacterota bacterium]
MLSTQADLLATLSKDEADRVMALGRPLTMPAGSVLFDLGAPADRVFVVERGRVALTLPMQVGGVEEDVLVEEKQAGETFGWSGLVPPHRYTLKAGAAVESVVWTLPRAALLEHFAARPEIGYIVTRNLAAVIGRRLQIFQTMWLREMQRVVELRYP